MTGSVYTAYGNTAGALSTPWQQYTGPGGSDIYIDVNTSFARFPGPPVYSTILRGTSGHWETTGVTSIYNATANGFRVYVRRPDGRTLTPQEARDNGWYIEWVGTFVLAGEQPLPAPGAPSSVLRFERPLRGL